ncbi:lamin tail domain-containing protein [bacterium]|nr:lamin tail domain-containing protein [bacterium]
MISLKPGRFPAWIPAFCVLYIYGAIPAATAAVPAHAGDEQTVRINEFMALNSTGLSDMDGDRSDWIELHNPGPGTADLAGWSLSDDADDPGQWVFPNVLIPSGGFLTVFASGKNRTDPVFELHANFRLDRAGEYLGLFDPSGTAVTEFKPAYPEQSADVSTAFLRGAWVRTNRPTPGAENRFGSEAVLQPPVFSGNGGFFDAPFDLVITAEPAEADIRYTTDGSAPGPDSGTPVHGPIRIETTTVLRAAAFLADSASSRPATATFLFVDDVIRQPDRPDGYPSEWGPFTAIPGTAPADYGMDPEVTQSAEWGPAMRESLLSLPALSIVTDRGHLFSKDRDPDTGGIYIYTGPPGNGDVPQLGDGWIRPASVELIHPDGAEGFQVDCGLALHGGHSRRPEKTPKHSFRLVFRSAYGPGRLEHALIPGVCASLNSVILRATYGNTWLHMNHSERRRCQLIRDLWAKDTQTAMGHVSGRGTYVHLFLNGLYWGVYNPTERIDREFAAERLGGGPDDWDVIKDYGEVVDGNRAAWDRMMALARAGLSADAACLAIQGLGPDGRPDPGLEPYVDAVNLIDYMILNFYGANWDWDHHNWVAARDRRNPGPGFRFFSWDAEHVIEEIDADNLNENNSGSPSFVFQQMMKNSRFRRLFADRVQRHCFNGGVLTPESAAGRWNVRSSKVEQAIVAESARWGDYRRDVHPYTSAGPFMLYLPSHWQEERSFIVNEHFPQRTSVFLSRLKTAGFFPRTDAPVFLVNGARTASADVSAGDVLTLTTRAGSIRYTLDGTDPADETPCTAVYSGPIVLTGSAHIRARALNGSEWSAMNEAVFRVPAEMANLAVTEIHYHPLGDAETDPDRFEFIELKNSGPTALDLAAASLCRGVAFTFPSLSPIAPGGCVVLSPDPAAFAARYGFAPFGKYEGNLDNGGETLAMTDASGDTLFSFRYDDRHPWPEAADGGGYSLAAKDDAAGGNPGDPGYWRLSLQPGGSPGRDDTDGSAVRMRETEKPVRFGMDANFPNPFNPDTRIRFAIPGRADVELDVFDVRGRRIRTLLSNRMEAGTHEIEWDGSDDRGLPCPSGVYIVRLEADGQCLARKIVLGR